MDSKRKANGSGAAETPDRSAKRRKVTDFDLSKGESRESTTAYGHAFLDQIRRTADKSGRQVATYFETLPPRAGNAEYYKRTKLLISLQKIEERLDNGEFRNLAQLESYFKRMIANAKDFYPRSSQVYDDAERVRKALSNYMTKTNPAYGTRGYQALPTPLPGEEDDEDEGGEEEAEDEDDDEGDGEADDDEEDAEEDEEDEDEDDEPTKRRSIVLKRRGPGRPPKNPALHAESRRQSAIGVKQDHQYDGVPYKGLSFQEAQEKVIEELLRYQAPEFDGYFEPFVNLPPRALKDYYKVISDPLSLKKLQKEIKGVHGRNDATGVTDFKSWSAFHERSKLLWTNAYYYNEEGSDIYDLAKELEKAFSEQLKQAKAVVAEPAQPKIRLKSTQQAVETPTPQTNGARLPAIDVARSASVSAASPTPSVPTGAKADESASGSPAVISQGAGQGQQTPGLAGRPLHPGMPQQMMPPAPAVPYVEPKRLRATGKGIKDALISRLRVQLHPGTSPTDDPVILDVLPLPREMQQSGTVNVPPSLNRVFVVPQLPEFLQERQYSLWLMIDKQPLKPIMQQLPNFLPSERVFDVMLHPGVNIIEAHLISAVPKEEREQVGSEVELEVFTAYVNVLRT